MKYILFVLCMSLVLTSCGISSKNKVDIDTEDVEITSDILQEEEVTGEPPSVEEAIEENKLQAVLIKVTGDALNVRNIPTTMDSAKRGLVLQESVYEVLEEAKDENNQVWYKIEFESNEFGWIAGWFTESYDNTNNYQLTGAQWRDYNNIQKQMTDGTWYKEVLKKDRLSRSLVYDFDLDGIPENVHFDFQLKDLGESSKVIGRSIITYKDQTLAFDYVNNGEYPWGLTEIGVMDVTSDDQSIEFYIKEGDLADRVLYAIYRITDGQLMQLATMSGEILGVYGDGRIYYWGGHLIEPSYNEAHNPDMAIAYYDLEQDDYVTTEQSIGKSKVLTWTVILYKNNEDVIDGAPLEFDRMLEMTKDSRVALLEAGDTIKVLEIDPLYRRAKVSTVSGYTGWIGGFHMVWD